MRSCEVSTAKFNIINIYIKKGKYNPEILKWHLDSCCENYTTQRHWPLEVVPSLDNENHVTHQGERWNTQTGSVTVRHNVNVTLRVKRKVYRWKCRLLHLQIVATCRVCSGFSFSAFVTMFQSAAKTLSVATTTAATLTRGTSFSIRRYCQKTPATLRVSEAVSGAKLGANVKVQVTLRAC